MQEEVAGGGEGGEGGEARLSFDVRKLQLESEGEGDHHHHQQPPPVSPRFFQLQIGSQLRRSSSAVIHNHQTPTTTSPRSSDVGDAGRDNESNSDPSAKESQERRGARGLSPRNCQSLYQVRMNLNERRGQENSNSNNNVEKHYEEGGENNVMDGTSEETNSSSVDDDDSEDDGYDEAQTDSSISPRPRRALQFGGTARMRSSTEVTIKPGREESQWTGTN